MYDLSEVRAQYVYLCFDVLLYVLRFPSFALSLTRFRSLER